MDSQVQKVCHVPVDVPRCPRKCRWPWALGPHLSDPRSPRDPPSPRHGPGDPSHPSQSSGRSQNSRLPSCTIGKIVAEVASPSLEVLVTLNGKFYVSVTSDIQAGVCWTPGSELHSSASYFMASHVHQQIINYLVIVSCFIFLIIAKIIQPIKCLPALRIIPPFPFPHLFPCVNVLSPAISSPLDSCPTHLHWQVVSYPLASTSVGRWTRCKHHADNNKVQDLQYRRQFCLRKNLINIIAEYHIGFIQPGHWASERFLHWFQDLH